MTLLHERFEHVAVVHDGPDELAELLAPSVTEALERDEAVLICLDVISTARLRTAIGDRNGVTFLPAATRYSRPGAAMHALQKFLAKALTDDVPAAWSIGTIPFDGTDLDRRWVRYEHAVDEVLGHLPLRAVCTYDVNNVPAPMLGTAHRCHHAVHGNVDAFAGDDVDHHLDRPRSCSPDLEVEVTTTRPMRRRLCALLADALAPARLDDVLLAATELATNALLHGAPPVMLRAWRADDGVVIDVVDHGNGIADPLADLRPLNGGPHGGYGLWLVGELADEITITRNDDTNVVTAFFANA